jgi:hypothetical protein
MKIDKMCEYELDVCLYYKKTYLCIYKLSTEKESKYLHSSNAFIHVFPMSILIPY